MALTFDLTKCEGLAEKYPHIETPNGKDWNPITQVVIYSTMFAELGEITEQNWQDFYKRIHMFEKAFGTHLLIDGEKKHLTPEMIRDHIGLTANVRSTTTQAFNAKIIRELSSDANRKLIEFGAEEAAKKVKP